MSDSYQAIYDAVRSRVHGCSVGDAMESVLRECFGDAHHFMASVAQEYEFAAYEQQRPSAVFKPKIYKDGNQWCALLGDDLQGGVCGFGDSPDLAARDFDKHWITKVDYE